jgi:hypothetical protein
MPGLRVPTPDRSHASPRACPSLLFEFASLARPVLPALMSEKGSEPDIETRRMNVAEVPYADIGPWQETWGAARGITHSGEALGTPAP